MLDMQGVSAQPQSAPFSSQDAARKEAQMAHLLSQIAFLHREVERLEEQASIMRMKSSADVQKMARQYEETIARKTAEIESLQHKGGVRDDGVDLSKRCKLLEKQLATVNSEMNVVTLEKNDLQAKMRKLEAVLKNRKKEYATAQRDAEESDEKRSSTITALKMAVEGLTAERDGLNKQIQELIERHQIKRADAETATERSLRDAESQTVAVERLAQACQVCTIHEAGREDAASASATHSLRALLEEKTRECDDLRSRLEDLSAVQRDAMSMLDAARRQAAAEAERRKLATDDAEGLLVQIRGLQQRCSDQTAAERMLGERIGILEDEKQRLMVEKTRIERDRDSWEEQLRQYERDVAQLSVAKNHGNQQLSSLANENEGLRVELQGFAEREAQMAYSLKAKDAEMQEILLAYRRAAQENESLAENQRFLERELDNARALIASKEEGLLYVQEQLQTLHAREQQLTLDLQSYEYENETLHQRLARADEETSAVERKYSDVQQVLRAKERSTEELHQSLRELSDQIIYKDNESLLLRQRCDELIADVTRMRAQLAAGRSRVQDLEEANARLVTRGVLLQEERLAHSDALLSQNDERVERLAMASEHNELVRRTEALSKANEGLAAKLATAESSLKEAIESKERLHSIVLEQNKALALLAK